MKFLFIFLCISGVFCKERSKPVSIKGKVKKEVFFRDIPKIDVHTHISLFAYPLALEIMERYNIRFMINLSGGFPGDGLEFSLKFSKLLGERVKIFCNLDWEEKIGPRFIDRALLHLNECARMGAIGLKIGKGLGLEYKNSKGKLIMPDSSLLDPIFERAGELGLVVSIHTADPKAFFLPFTPQNERYEELLLHPHWRFFGPKWPKWEDLLDAFERRVARHPNTTIIGVHFGNSAEEPDRVARMLSKYPNYYIDTSARIPEFGRHPKQKMRKFFIKFKHRILFGSDIGISRQNLVLGSPGPKPPSFPKDVDRFFNAHWAYFESKKKKIPHPTPIQGKWKVNPLNLPKDVLKRIYYKNAEQLFKLSK
jgi:predicted TIM-barrel fold metal-dependent hydrolase